MLFDRIKSHIEADNQPAAPSRRSFLKVSAVTGGGLLMSIGLPAFIGEAEAAPAGPATTFVPNAYIRIGHDSRPVLVMPQVEMGQGVYTSLAQLIAEELEVDLAQVRIEHAPADDKRYANPVFGFQATGGSTSIAGHWEILRKAGATARTMLVQAAATNWKVDPATCVVEKGVVHHKASKRQTEYGLLVDRAAKLPVPATVALKDPKDFTLIGKPAKRVDSRDKVTGKAMFGMDVRLPGMKIAAVAASPVFGGKVAKVDDTKAKAVKGVRQIVRLDDAVAVVADHTGAARKGLAALEITWDEGPNASFNSVDLVQQMAEAAKGTKAAIAHKEGDVATGMKDAAQTIEAIYEMPFLAHATMEPQNCTVHVRKGACDVWTGTQVMTRAQAAAAKVTGLPIEKVTVHNQMLGGGFGRRLDIDMVTQAVQIATKVKGPVKVVWSREEDTQHDVYRPYYYDRFTAGLDKDGMPVAFDHRVVGSSIVARWLAPAFKNDLDFDAVDGGAGPYKLPNALVDYVRHEPPAGMTTGWWRGVGITHNAFVVEGFIDELAAAAGKEPVEYRRALLKDNPRALAVLNLAAEKAGWGKPMPAGSGRGISVLFGFGSFVATVAEVAVDKGGQVRVTRVVCAVDCGHVVNPDTVEAQLQGGTIFGLTAALYGEITVKNGRVEQANFDTYQPLRMNEAPAIEVHLVKSTEKPGGIGEPGTAAIAPAVVNAVFAATGKRIRKLPIDPKALVSA